MDTPRTMVKARKNETTKMMPNHQSCVPGNYKKSFTRWQARRHRRRPSLPWGTKPQGQKKSFSWGKKNLGTEEELPLGNKTPGTKEELQQQQRPTFKGGVDRTKRNETKRNETKRNETKRNKTNKTSRINTLCAHDECPVLEINAQEDTSRKIIPI